MDRDSQSSCTSIYMYMYTYYMYVVRYTRNSMVYRHQYEYQVTIAYTTTTASAHPIAGTAVAQWDLTPLPSTRGVMWSDSPQYCLTQHGDIGAEIKYVSTSTSVQIINT